MYLHISSKPPTVTGTAVVLELRSPKSLSSHREVSVIAPTVAQVFSTIQHSPLSISMSLFFFQAAIKSQSYVSVSSKLAFWLIFLCSFQEFLKLFPIMSLFANGHVTKSCKGPYMLLHTSQSVLSCSLACVAWRFERGAYERRSREKNKSPRGCPRPPLLLSNKNRHATQAKTVQIMLLPKPVGKIAMTSLPLRKLLMAVSCSGFKTTALFSRRIFKSDNALVNASAIF